MNYNTSNKPENRNGFCHFCFRLFKPNAKCGLLMVVIAMSFVSACTDRDLGGRAIVHLDKEAPLLISSGEGPEDYFNYVITLSYNGRFVIINEEGRSPLFTLLDPESLQIVSGMGMKGPGPGELSDNHHIIKQNRRMPDIFYYWSFLTKELFTAPLDAEGTIDFEMRSVIPFPIEYDNSQKITVSNDLIV